MELCVFQGTFNPIHNAHLRVAEYVLNKYNFDKLVFIPAANPPHKDCDLNFSLHRLKMAELAVRTNPKFAVSDIEYRRDGKSYTYLTIKDGDFPGVSRDVQCIRCQRNGKYDHDFKTV